jgi:homoserine O-acetyltransferase
MRMNKCRLYCFAFGILALAAGRPTLAHWPDQPPHRFADLGEFTFERGGKIPNLRMSYVTHGKLNAAKDNAILFMHGWGSNHHGFDQMIGPGKPLDTDRYFIICTDELGNSQTTFEHTTSPTNSGLKMNFPQYNGRDKIKAEYKLVTEVLGIQRLLAVTGISSGADHSVQMAVAYPHFMDGILPVSGGALSSTQGFFYGALYMSVIESARAGRPGTTMRIPGNAHPMPSQLSCPIFTAGNGGSGTSTIPRRIRPGAINGATTISISRIRAISTIG